MAGCLTRCFNKPMASNTESSAANEVIREGRLKLSALILWVAKKLNRKRSWVYKSVNIGIGLMKFCVLTKSWMLIESP